MTWILRVARKGHKCSRCGGEIGPGELYLVNTGSWTSGRGITHYYSYKYHLRCAVDVICYIHAVDPRESREEHLERVRRAHDLATEMLRKLPRGRYTWDELLEVIHRAHRLAGRARIGVLVIRGDGG